MSDINAERNASSVEVAAVGALLMGAPEVYVHADALNVDAPHFIDPDARTCAAAALDLHRRGEAPSFFTVIELLRTHLAPDDYSRISVFARDALDRIVSPADGIGALSVLHRDHLRRQVADDARRLMEAAEKSDDPAGLISEAAERFRNLELDTPSSKHSWPAIVEAASFTSKPFPAPPEIVQGVLHKGSKAIYGGPSKAFKTWTLLDLALAVATGGDWLGFKCSTGRVLYLNFELQDFGIHRRILAIAQDRGIAVPAGLHLWNLRGYATPLTRLLPELLRRIRGEGYDLIIPDPIYKTLQGRDENDTGDISAVCNEVEAMAVQTGAAVAFGAHYAKGNAAAKVAIDRISGSGVFARDPDSIITATPHDEDDCFSINMVLRNFPPPADFTIRWEYPRMRRDATLDPGNLRQPASPAKMERPAIETLFEQALALFADGPLRAGMFQDLVTPITGTRDRCRELRARLLHAGHLDSHEIRGDRRHEVWLGTPAQIERVRHEASKP